MQQQVNSGGAGYGAGLGSQGALILNETHSWLFAVNAGDNTVSLLVLLQMVTLH